MVKGFSIVELMVVSIIIGIVSFIGINKYNVYQAETRDSIRKLHLKTLAKALQVYYLKHKSYPATGGAWRFGNTRYSYADGWIPGLAPKYISELPLDPFPDGSDQNTKGGYWYIDLNNSQGFVLKSGGFIEDPGGPEYTPQKGDPFYMGSSGSGSNPWVDIGLIGGKVTSRWTDIKAER